MNTDRLDPYYIPNYITYPRKLSYEDWLKSPVMEASDITDDSDFKKIYFSNGDYYTRKHFIIDFCDGLIKSLHQNGFNIQHEKEFKRKVAIFIYRLSRERL